MVILSDRFPSRDQVIPVLATISFVVNTWMVYRLVYYIPAWLHSMTTVDILFTTLYAFAFALFESLIILVGLLFLAFILPGKYLKGKFVSQGIGMVLLASVGMLYLQDNVLMFHEWQAKQFIYALIATPFIFAAIFVVVFLLANYVKAYEKFINWIAERITVFLYVYLPLGVLGVIVVILRNIYLFIF